MTDQQYPIPATGAFIFNKEGKLFLVKSHKFKDKYMVPGGKVEVGESIKDNLIREIKEETNMDIYDIEFIGVQEMIFDESFWKKIHFIFLDYKCKTDSEKVVLNEEAQDYVWVTLSEALELDLDKWTRTVIEKWV